MRCCSGNILVLVFLPGVLFFACSPHAKNAEKILSVIPEDHSPVYLVKPSGHEPYYFELGVDGPVLVPSPREASLNPFMPWTHSRFISGFLPLGGNGEGKEEILYASVNKGGILALTVSSGTLHSGLNKREGPSGEIAVYYYKGGETRENYLLSALFSFNQKPAALFARERFFSAGEQAFLPSSIWTVSGPFLEKITIPALNMEEASGWETSNVFLGKDKNWYFRKINSKGESAYFYTTGLSREGEEINAERYLEFFSPLEADSPSVPPLLAWAIAESSRLAGNPCIAGVVSPEFPAKRLFCSKGAIPAEGENMEQPGEFSGYYRPPAPGKEELAVILFPDGRGVYGRSKDGAVKDGRFTLPALPANKPGSFAYTGIALLEENPELYLIASWEEQQNWNVGAAGFLLLEIDW